MQTIHVEHFTKAFLELLDETFDNVKGYYLDKGTSFFETLAVISSEQASIPHGRCASLAAQVKHVSFYLNEVVEAVNDPNHPNPDWGEIWRTVEAVTPEEWSATQAELRSNYEKIKLLVAGSKWESDYEIAGALGVLAHTAYHLGEIRQALCHS